jgi:hypothetical protein
MNSAKDYRNESHNPLNVSWVGVPEKMFCYSETSHDRWIGPIAKVRVPVKMYLKN